MATTDNTVSEDQLAPEVLELLELGIDDIEDLPGFECPVDGQYLLKMNAAIKKINEKQSVEMSYEVMETLKKNNESDATTVPGTKFSQLFFLQGEPDSVKMSMGALKAIVKPIAEATGQGNLLALVRDVIKDYLVSAKVTGKKDKNDPEIRRPRVANVTPM